MKKFKQKKSIIFIVISLFIIMTNSFTVNATTFSSYTFTAEINEDGSANIVSEWTYEDDSGTEHYFPISKAGIGITDLKVKRNGIDYDIIDEWDVEASFEDKANKAGFNDLDDEIEVCWGIGEYGTNTYEVSYKINGFVKNLNDSQMIHYRLLNDGLSEAPENAKYIIKRSGGKPFNDEVKIWAFGYEGETYIEDGNIIGIADLSLSPSNYMHALIQFPSDTFNVPVGSYIDEDFEYFKDIAFNDSDYLDDQEEPSTDQNSNKSFFKDLFNILKPLSIFYFVFYQLSKRLPNDDFVNLQINKNEYKGEYYSNNPYRGDLSQIYFLLNELNMTSQGDIISYFILKWIKEGVLIKEDVLQSGLFKKDKTQLRILKEPLCLNNIDDSCNVEAALFEIFKEAAVDNCLEEGEFDKWMSSRKNQIKYENFIDKMEDLSEDYLFAEGYLYREKVEKKPNDYHITRLSPYGKELAVNLVKFQNYLKDYSLLNERDSINIHLWDELMLYAAVFGITEEVNKEFNKIYPNYTEQTQYQGGSINTSVIIGNHIARSYRSNTDTSSSRSMGGGGSSSIGGGGGGFGGSSGGGTR